MKLLIAGTRTYKNFSKVCELIDKLSKPTLVLSGGAEGADALGEEWAHMHGIPVKQYLPEWKRFGKSAGPLRNQDMARDCDVAVLFWDGVSPGTKNMMQHLELHNKPYTVFRYDLFGKE